MSVIDDIINGNYSYGGKKRKELMEDSSTSIIESIIDGTYQYKSGADEYIKNEENSINNSSWFKKSSAFDDDKGSIFTDAAKTVFSTAGDIGTGIAKGVMNIGEGIGDTISYGIAQHKENKGDLERANQIREKAQVNLVDKIFNPVQRKIDENSILGNKTDSIVEGLGYVAGMTAIGVATGGAGAGVASAATTATTFSSAMGQGMSQAYQEGANDDEAWKFGVISGLAEAGSELFFGGLGKASGALGLSKGITSIDDTLAKKVSETFKSTIGKNLSEYVIKAGAEGTEEIISGFIQALGQKATYKKDKDFWGELVKDQNLLEQFVAGAVTSAIAQVPGQNGIYKTTKNGRDFITGLTQNEAKVYDKELSTRVSEKTKSSAIENAYNEQIKTQEKLGMELSENDKNIIRQSIEEAYDSGRIKADKKLSSKLYDELEQNVRRDLEDGNISIDTIRNTIGENQDIGKDKLLQKSLYEEEQKNVAYQVQKTDNEKVNILYQSATDSGMNNNNITRKKVELVAKLTKDTDRQYKFVSPEQLKEMGYNENANGLINKETGEILINSRSENGLQAIIGHETTHIFDSTNEAGEYSKEYQDLQNYVIEYAKQKGIYEDKIKNITQAYGNILENEKQVNEELTADLIGDFLFNDSEFIEQLSTKNRNVFQKIYDYIKHSIKLATAGSKEARQLENIKYQFDKVYKTISEETNTDIKYSMTKSNITGDDIAIKDMQKQEKNPVLDNYIGQYENNSKNIGITEKTANENGSETNLKTKARNYISRSKTSFKNDIITKFGTSKIANTNLLNYTVENIQNDIISNGKLNDEQINNYFNELYDNLKKIDTVYYDEYKEVKKVIKNTKFYIPENIKSDITDFEQFRKNNMSNIIMTNNPENISIDTKYKELSEMYPELFPDDINNQSDQLLRISEVAKDISKVETNVSAYNDKYMGKEYRNWAREEFGTAISNLTKDINTAMRYNRDSAPIDKINLSKEEVKEVYKQLPNAKKTYEKALAKEVLTKNDRIQVDRLLNGEIDIGELPKNSNKEGIVRLATAKAEYDALQKSVNEYVKNIKEARIEQAEQDIGDLNQWKDKKIGFQYSRETPIRNIYDVAPKNIADNIANKYFRSYIEVNEKKVINNIQNYNEKVKELNIETKDKYKILFDGETKKVSESALIQLLGEKKITTQQIKDAGADVVKIENAVNTFRNIYNELIDKINDSMLDNGYAPMEYRKDYFPHFTEEKADTLLGKAAKLIGINISNKDNLPTDISGQTMNFKPGRTWFANMLQRTTDITDYDVLKGFDKYIRGASDLIYHTNDIQNLRALSTAIRGTYNDTEIQNKVNEIKESTTMNELEKSEAIKNIYEQAKDKSHLSKFIEWLDNYTNILAGKKSINDRSSEKELNRKMYSTMQSVESRFAANAIGGNVGVALTNFAPLAQATGEIKTSNIIAGMWQTMKSSIKGDTNFVSESQFITRRRGTEYLHQTTTDKITNLLTSPLEFADNFTSEAIVRAKYIQNIQEGMSEQVALENADRYTAGLMADRGRGALPTQFNNKNPLAKMVNMFQVEVNNQWSYYFKDLPKNLQEEGKNNLIGACTKIMVGSYLINELLGSIRGNSTRVLPDPIYIIKELIKGLSDDDDDNDADIIKATLGEIIGNMPFISLPATMVGEKLIGSDDIGKIPLTGMVPDLGKVISGDKDLITELRDTIGASLILPFGGAQLKKTIKGLDLYSKDKPVAGSYTDNGDLKYTVDEDVGSKVKSALFGAYANPYADDYVKSGYKSIKADNIEELVALGMNSIEYRNIKKELSEASDTSDKNGYKQYVDKDDKVYWYDEKNKIMYNSNYEKTTLTDNDLIKVSKKEEALNYINSLDLTDSQKNIMANNINKNSKKTIDMKEYSKYNSYDEYQYARDHSEKYSVIKQITSYDNYNDYMKQIKSIKDEYKIISENASNSKQKSAISKEKKKVIQNYIENLPLNSCQKMMMEKEAGYSINTYKNQIHKYLESQNLSKSEKYNIWKELFD